MIFGGMANLTGSILGAAAVTLLEPVLRRTIHTDPARRACTSSSSTASHSSC